MFDSPFNGNDSCNDKWYCLHCGWNANIETWLTRIGIRYVCIFCGVGGNLKDDDAPKYLNINEQKDHESDYDFVKRIWRP